MKHLRVIVISLIFIVSAFTTNASSSYDVAELYSVIKPTSGTKAVGKYDKTIDVEYILTLTKVDTGKYIVEVKKIGDNLIKSKTPIFVLKQNIATNGLRFQER